jgi:hypothetical protein
MKINHGGPSPKKPLRPLVSGLAVLLVLAASAPGMAAKCNLEPVSPRFVLSNDAIKVKYNHGLGRGSIATKARRLGFSGGRPNVDISGLTSSSYETRYQVKVQTRKIGRNRYCAQLLSVEAWAGFTGMTVYVAREYKRGSCQYRAILDHEHQHVAINRRVFQKYLPKIEKTLRATARKMGPFVASSPNGAGKIVTNRLKAALRPTASALDRALDKSNANIDTKANYKRVNARCRKW